MNPGFYHGSVDPLAIGTVLEGGRRSGPVEDLFEAYAPSSMPYTSVFMVERPEDAERALPGLAVDHVYEVEPVGAVRGPFDSGWYQEIAAEAARRGLLGRRDLSKRPMFAKMADAYWRGLPSPTPGVKEYLAQGARVVREVGEGGAEEASKTRLPRADCSHIQQWLYDYLKTEVDPYDFNFAIADWIDKEGITDDGVPYAEPTEVQPADLTQEQLKAFTKWIKSSGEAELYTREMPFESPAYLTLHAKEMLPAGSWFMHFTNEPSFEHFDRGATIDGLHLSTWKKRKDLANCSRNLLEDQGLAEVVFGFAYSMSGADMADVSRGLHKYGRHMLVFQCDCAVEAYHDGDEEYQSIFPVCSEYNVQTIDTDSYLGLGVDDGAGNLTWFKTPEALIAHLEARPKRRRTRAAAHEEPRADLCDSARVWYHGSTHRFRAFRPTHGVPVFLTCELSTARDHAGPAGFVYTVRPTPKQVFRGQDLFLAEYPRWWPPQPEEMSSIGRRLYEDLQAGRVFESLRPEQVDDAFKAVAHGYYDVMESSQMRGWLVDHGYDAFTVRETHGEPVSLAVMDPSRLKIVKMQHADETRQQEASVRENGWRGLSRGHKPEEFDPDQLAAGIKVEMEHTNDPAMAKRIAMDHLVEDPRYYDKLASAGLEPAAYEASRNTGHFTVDGVTLFITQSVLYDDGKLYWVAYYPHSDWRTVAHTRRELMAKLPEDIAAWREQTRQVAVAAVDKRHAHEASSYVADESLPFVLVQAGDDVVPVLLGEDPSASQLVGVDVDGRAVEFDATDILGLVNVEPAAVWYGANVEMVGEMRMAAEEAAKQRLSFVEQGLSPLSSAAQTPHMDPSEAYTKAARVYRYAAVDASAPPPNDDERYFHDWPGTRDGQIIPGAAAGTVGFVDWHYDPDATPGTHGIYVDYVRVRHDQRHKGVAERLTRAFYEMLMQRGVREVYWGRVVTEHAWRIMQMMQSEFPEIRTWGKASYLAGEAAEDTRLTSAQVRALRDYARGGHGFTERFDVSKRLKRMGLIEIYDYTHGVPGWDWRSWARITDEGRQELTKYDEPIAQEAAKRGETIMRMAAEAGRSPWGYAIDYDKEIVEDERRVAMYDSEMAKAIAASLTPEETAYRSLTWWDWLFYKPESVSVRSAIVGVHDEELPGLILINDLGSLPEWMVQIEDKRKPGDAARAREIAKRLDAIEILSEELRVKLLHKAKTDLARHRRNKEKYGAEEEAAKRGETIIAFPGLRARKGMSFQVRPRGQRFQWSPEKPRGLTAFPEVKPVLLRQREQVPSLESIRMAAIFAGLTVHAGTEEAEETFTMLLDRYKSMHGAMPPVEMIQDILARHLPTARARMYESVLPWSTIVQKALNEGLRDRELRRYLWVDLTAEEQVESIGLAKMSFALMLMGQNVCCLDTWILGAMFAKDPFNQEDVQEAAIRRREAGDRISGQWKWYEGKKTRELGLQRYEQVEDALLKGNPWCKPGPIARAQCQWQSWEWALGVPAAHRVWLEITKELQSQAVELQQTEVPF